MLESVTIGFIVEVVPNDLVAEFVEMLRSAQLFVKQSQDFCRTWPNLTLMLCRILKLEFALSLFIVDSTSSAVVSPFMPCLNLKIVLPGFMLN